MKKTLILSLLTAGAIAMSLRAMPVRAVDDMGAGGLLRAAGNLQNQASRSADLSQKRLAEIISHADTMIANRITTLNTLNTRIQNDSRLTADEKSTFQGQVQSVISGLTALKTKIDADTTADAALTDAKQIVTSYRVYMEMEPQMRLLITLNNVKATVTRIQGIVPQLQNLINTLSGQGKDVSGLTPLLADITTQLQNALTSINADIATVSAVTPATPDPSVTFKQVRNDVQNVIRADLTKVRQDIAQMRTILKTVIGKPHPTGMPEPTAAVTAAPSPTTVPADTATPVPTTEVPTPTL